MSQNPLAYVGINPYITPPFITAQRSPLSTDVRLPGTRWMNQAVEPNLIFQTSGAGVWDLMTPGSTTISSIVTDSGTATPSSGVINLLGGSGASTSATGDTITVTASGGGGGLTWQDIALTGSTTAGVGYMSTAAITLTLPASPTNGDEIAFVASTSDTLIIQANTGQVVQVGSERTSSAGTATSTALGDSLNLIYQSSSTKWFSIATNGNWNLA